MSRSTGSDRTIWEAHVSDDCLRRHTPSLEPCRPGACGCCLCIGRAPRSTACPAAGARSNSPSACVTRQPAQKEKSADDGDLPRSPYARRVTRDALNMSFPLAGPQLACSLFLTSPVSSARHPDCQPLDLAQQRHPIRPHSRGFFCLRARWRRKTKPLGHAPKG